MLTDLGLAERQKAILPCRNAHSSAPARADNESSCVHCAIRSLSVCSSIESLDILNFSILNSPITTSAKSNLFGQGELAENIYILTRGIARLYKLLPDGRRQIVGFSLPGDLLGFNASDRYGVSADAVTEVGSCRFARSSFESYISDKPHILRGLFGYISNELSLAQDQIVLLGRRSAEERIAAFVVGMRRRLRRVGHVSVTLPLLMSRQDIADYLGLTIETVSRTFTKLAKDRRILLVPDGVRIMDVEGLEKLAAG